jgi:hypothetical protein
LSFLLMACWTSGKFCLNAAKSPRIISSLLAKGALSLLRLCPCSMHPQERREMAELSFETWWVTTMDYLKGSVFLFYVRIGIYNDEN